MKRAFDRLAVSVRRPTFLLCALPVLIILFNVLGPFRTDSLLTFANVGLDLQGGILKGRPTIDPNIGVTAEALGKRAALDLISGVLPLWNHYEGLGAPLLGGLQSAALFPPTLLLLLPHGQAIEHALLQLLAGWGAFLFFRRFGLGTTAAVVGGVLFELNGVFAWLRNAIFNPVAFLPWLLYAFEGLRAAALAGERFPQRAPVICLGGTMGALALYAGFPEVTYLYVLLVAAWAVFRLWGLTRAQAMQVVADGVLIGVLALALSAPALTAFVEYLGEANVAGHTGDGFYGEWLSTRSFIQYLLPYVYGPIWDSYDPLIMSVWGGTGGYLGFLPLVAALAALFAPGHRRTKFFLTGWIVVALGASHGWPGIYQAFMALPLAKMAAVYRYINTSWIFCAIFMTALWVDSVPALPRRQLQRALILAAVVAIALAAAAAVAGWPLFVQLWAAAPRFHIYTIAAVTVAIGLLAGLIGGALARGGRSFGLMLAGLLVVEAAAWFVVPFLSYPLGGRVDGESIAFLRDHAGYNRVMNSFTDRGYGILPNYGSAFGFATLNYDNVPVPRLTVDYVKERLDPYASQFFAPWEPGLDSDKRAARLQAVRDRLPLYAAAGVKYVMAGPDFDPRLALVFRGESMAVYEVPGARDYATAPDCTVSLQGHDVMDVDCARPSELLRLELYMRGWSATVGGQPAAVELREGAFQGVALPAGKSRVEFTYRPRGFTAALAAATAALLMMLAAVGQAVLRRRS